VPPLVSSWRNKPPAILRLDAAARLALSWNQDNSVQWSGRPGPGSGNSQRPSRMVRGLGGTCGDCGHTPETRSTGGNVSSYSPDSAADRQAATQREGRDSTAPAALASQEVRALGGSESRNCRGNADGRFLAPQVGLEPTTLRLTAECSAIELLRSVSASALACRNYIKAPRSLALQIVLLSAPSTSPLAVESLSKTGWRCGTS
jgi:hypothetical protein